MTVSRYWNGQNIRDFQLLRIFHNTAIALLLAAMSASAAGDAPGAGDAVDVSWFIDGGNGASAVRLYFFWSRLCPHCLDALPFVERLEKEHDWIRVHNLQLVDEPNNIRLYIDLAAGIGEEARSVPAFVFCGRMETGYADESTTGQYLLEALAACHAKATGAPVAADDEAAPQTVTVPLLGDVDATRLGLPLFTVTIAALDAFNPCAFFVLLFLLSLLVHARERLRIAIIGGIFVVTSGVVYFAFMSAWLNVFRWLGEIRLVTLVAGCIAVVIAAINIKDYFYFHRGISLSLPYGARPALFARIRGLASSQSYCAMIGGAIILAAAANSYELLCTAGLPMVYTRVLTLNDVSGTAAWLYLVLYNVIYVIPLIVIVALFAFTLGSRKLSEREGRVLKLASGLMMLNLGVLLVLRPTWLSNPLVAVAALASAVALTVLVVITTGLRRRNV